MDVVPSQNFSGALATWRDINLSELQKVLDAQGVELVDNQKESVLGRKALADKTKDFKRIPDEDKLSGFKSLLKAYQTEIDNLTRRSKAAENAFLNVYKVLAEAPDPYPLLEAAVDQAVKIAEALEAEIELKTLRQENNELKRRLGETESTKHRIESRLEQLEQKMEDLIQEKVSVKENELNATYDEKLRNYEEREQDLIRQVALAKQQLFDLRTSNESNQAKLLDRSQRQDHEVMAKLAELDMIVADLDRANSRIATVERRNEILRAEIETLRSGQEASDRVKLLESQITELESEKERLGRSLETHKTSATETNLKAAKKIEELTKEIGNKSTEIDSLRSKLKHCSDYDDIKRELDIMKYVEFAALVEDDEGTVGLEDNLNVRLPDPKADAKQPAESLEALLATKNRRMLEELTKFRILHSELESSLQASQTDLEFVRLELSKQVELNEKLENDLLTLNGHQGNGSSDTGVIADLELGKAASKYSQNSFSSSADTSILPIVTGQRDRFRQRNAELEEELRKQFQIISELRNEVKNLQSDNLKLYEKVRYMQSYREDAGSRSIPQLDRLTGATGISDDMSTYSARYEATMNPFEAFRGREATRAYRNLNVPERAVLAIARSVAGSRRARSLFLIYIFTLHFLVFFATYRCSP